jgi:glycosyltransferase involved in cell wall biosynthesis
LKVHVHPADEGGCGWYRLRWPAAALTAQGHDVTLHDDIGTIRHAGLPGHPIVDVECDADVVVLQRVIQRSTYDLIPLLQRKGVAVVVEVDDDFHALPAGHPLRSRGQWSPARSPRWLMRACEVADLVTVSTAALADRYGAHGRVVVLPNMVPESYLKVSGHAPADRPVVGWTGSLATHVGDLEATGGGVAAALRATGARFHVIGTGNGVKDALGLDEHPSTTAGWVSLTDYPRAYAGLDVAIVPLAANAFNEAKSDLKGLEALALGVPFVASSTGPYRRLAADAGCGFLAECPDQWFGWTRYLVNMQEVREDGAEVGREYVREHRTVEGQAWRWLEAWDHAIKHSLSRQGRTHSHAV